MLSIIYKKVNKVQKNLDEIKMSKNDAVMTELDFSSETVLMSAEEKRLMNCFRTAGGKGGVDEFIMYRKPRDSVNYAIYDAWDIAGWARI